MIWLVINHYHSQQGTVAILGAFTTKRAAERRQAKELRRRDHDFAYVANVSVQGIEVTR